MKLDDQGNDALPATGEGAPIRLTPHGAGPEAVAVPAAAVPAVAPATGFASPPKASPLRRLYDWTIALAGHPRAEWSLAGVSFAESSFFPIPPDVLLVPMILADRSRAWRYAFICTVASVLGGILGYAIGMFLFETVGKQILTFYGLTHDFEEVAGGYNQVGWLMVLLGGGMTPLPYKVITIASGVTQLDFLTFVGVSVLARSMRFYVTCALLYRFGPAARTFIERRLGVAFMGLLVLIVGGLILARYVL